MQFRQTGRRGAGSKERLPDGGLSEQTMAEHLRPYAHFVAAGAIGVHSSSRSHAEHVRLLEGHWAQRSRERAECFPDNCQPGRDNNIRRSRGRYANGKNGEFVEYLCRETRTLGLEIPLPLQIRADGVIE